MMKNPAHSLSSITRTLAAVIAVGTLLSGCGMIARASRDETKGPCGMVREIQDPPFYKPSKLVPAGVWTYRIAEIPKTYEVLLDLNVGQVETSAVATNDTFSKSLSEQLTTTQNAYLNAGPLQGSAFMTTEVGSGQHVPGDYGAAEAWRMIRSKFKTSRQNLLQKKDNDAQVNLYFIHEAVEILPHLPEVALEPFGKVLSVTTSQGEVTAETREPVYTVSVPARHRLVVVAKDPKSGQEMTRAVYATWSKIHKFYRDPTTKAKSYYPDEEAAIAGYLKHKDLFAKEIATGPLFTSSDKTPAKFKDLPVTDLSVMSPEDAWGTHFTTDYYLYVMLPPKGDPAGGAWQACSTWFAIDDENGRWTLKDQYRFDNSWPAKAAQIIEPTLKDTKNTPQARAAAALTLATLKAFSLNGDGTAAMIAEAQRIEPDCLGEAGFISRGGMLDYGCRYYVGRHCWLNSANLIDGLSTWKGRSVSNATVQPQIK